MSLKIKSPSTLYLGSATRPNISNASGLTVRSLSTVYLGSAVDPESGGGIKFKTSIYATDNAYILLDRITANGIRVKGNIKTIKTGPATHTIVAFRTSSTSFTMANISYQYNSIVCNLTMGSQNNISNTQLINSSGQIVLENFDVTKKNMTTFYAKWGILCQNNNGSIDSYFNDVGRINLITLLYNDNEVANLVPAIVNGENGMYDTINEKFYGNANSVGSLICE